MFTQLNPPVPLDVVDKGPGIAYGVIDYGIDFDLIWVIFMDVSGECWCVPNPEVRAKKNYSLGRFT